MRGYCFLVIYGLDNDLLKILMFFDILFIIVLLMFVGIDFCGFIDCFREYKIVVCVNIRLMFDCY